MSLIRIELDGGAEINAALGRLGALMGDMTPLMRQFVGIMADAVEDNFDREQTPDGHPWEPLKPDTIKARESRGYWPGKILQQRGQLAASIAREFGSNYAAVGTNLEYAAIHQFGGDIQIAARSQRLYFKQGKDGTIGTQFVKKSKSNFAQWATLGAYGIHIPARPYLGLSAAAQAQILAAAEAAIKKALGSP